MLAAMNDDLIAPSYNNNFECLSIFMYNMERRYVAVSSKCPRHCAFVSVSRISKG